MCVSLRWKAKANRETRSFAPAKDITCPILPILSLFLFISRLAFVRAMPFQKVLPAC